MFWIIDVEMRKSNRLHKRRYNSAAVINEKITGYLRLLTVPNKEGKLCNTDYTP
jgi:hypothetical protein